MMRLYGQFMKRQALLTLLVGALYLGALLYLSWVVNETSSIDHVLDLYVEASDIPDFFFAFIVGIPFAWRLFFMERDGFLDYAALRTERGAYLRTYFLAMMSCCFLMVFVVNFLAIIYSTQIADISPFAYHQEAEGIYEPFLGMLQLSNPLLFGVIWSLFKAGLGALLCFLALLMALYVKNLFLALLLPFVYVLAENYITSVIGLQRFSVTTAIALNRLSAQAVKSVDIFIGVSGLVVEIGIIWLALRWWHERAK